MQSPGTLKQALLVLLIVLSSFTAIVKPSPLSA
jgi:hypothetical protein